LQSHSSFSMVQTPEQKKRLRYREALLKNQEPPTRTEVSRALLEEVRAELQQEVAAGRAAVKTEARAGKKRLRAVEQAACQSIRDAAEHEIKRVKEAAGAVSGGSVAMGAVEEPTTTTEPTSTTEANDSMWLAEKAEHHTFDHAKLREEAIRAERERLAPEREGEFTKAYESLATRPGSQFPGDPELPDGLKARAEMFFRVNPEFQQALQAKKRAAANNAVTGELERKREKCPHCQREKSLARGGYLCRQMLSCAWDHACAAHLALSVAEEVKLEVPSAEWAEKAINAWLRESGLAAKARCDSHARQRAEEAKSDRRREMEGQARERLRPETRRCEDCEEYDEPAGGMCPLHEAKHRALCADMSSEVAEGARAGSARTLALQC
jgi:hypothetical protein